MSDLVAGRVGRPHGLDGSFHVIEATAALLVEGGAVSVHGRATRVVRRAGTDARPILRLDVASDRQAAEALRGAELRVPRSAAPPLEEDEYPADELVGCRVVAGGRELGHVARLLAYPSCDLLELNGGQLVPLVGDAIRTIDVAEQVIEVDPAFLGI